MSNGGRRRGVPSALLLYRRERAARWQVAHLLLNQAAGEDGPISLERLGELIAEKLPWREDEPIDKSLMSRIENARIDAQPEVVVAFCAVLRDFGVDSVDPAWITYGGASRVARPEHPLMLGTRANAATRAGSQ